MKKKLTLHEVKIKLNETDNVNKRIDLLKKYSKGLVLYDEKKKHESLNIKSTN